MADICCIDNCGTWIGRPKQTICIDCKRKFKKVLMVRCQWEDCKMQIPEGTNRRYCGKHVAVKK